MYVLGISGMAHDSAAALLADGRVVRAMEEGKLSRSRSAQGIPRAAIAYCLSCPKISWRDVDLVAVASRPARTCLRETLFRARGALRAPLSSAYFTNKALGELGRELNNLRILREFGRGGSPTVREFDHHLCHASSAYHGSGYDRALIVTHDEHGDARAGLVAIGQGTEISEIGSISLPHSLAWLFSQVTLLLGFRPRRDEHKTQWLGLSGKPVYADLFLDMLRRQGPATPHLNPRFFEHEFGTELGFSPDFYRRLEIRANPENGRPELGSTERADIAASLQKALGTILSDWLESLRAKTKQRFLCLAGGLFLNPLLVRAIEHATGFEAIFVQPASGNEGTALGAAWLAWHEEPAHNRAERLSNLYFGPSFSNEEIKAVLDNSKAPYRWCDSEDHKIDEALRLLTSGKIVAWFQGGAEFGPRALGNRSLLAYPWAPYVQENLNDYIKHREAFRPFALSIPAENSDEYFETSANARFMTTMAVPNQRGAKLLDGLSGLVSGGLARLHVVRSGDNPLFWKLLRKTGETGPAPILVNTSFNLFGEPLVITPRDAVRSFYCSGTDALIAGSFLLTKG
ncbi:MAG TPA: carbamoyltransferase C-terminal domain-containing protein [Candidatus Cybelea sp.]|nr:carbamoyltransferase C-terminal domain-containing protein [Candidatus Cybelea sp.]